MKSVLEVVVVEVGIRGSSRCERGMMKVELCG
jgi:hypothetical protein